MRYKIRHFFNIFAQSYVRDQAFFNFPYCNMTQYTFVANCTFIKNIKLGNPNYTDTRIFFSNVRKWFFIRIRTIRTYIHLMFNWVRKKKEKK